MASKSEKKMQTEAVAEAVERALDIEFSASDLTIEQAPAPDQEDTLFNELEAKLTAAANDLKKAEKELESSLNNPAPPSQSRSSTAGNRQTSGDGAGKASTGRRQAGTMSEHSPSSPPVPANDETQSTISELVYKLQRRPSKTPFVVAAIVSCLWVGLVWLYVQANHPQLLSNNTPLSTRLFNTQSTIYIGLALIPVMMLWAFAGMLRRAQEMRQAAGSMTEAAIRLMQPESIATDSIRSVGSAIRREVSAMGDGVERALARAGELENIVQGEVLSIQRSYTDSEIKLRSLLTDISDERTNILKHSENLRESISGSHVTLTKELALASGRIKGVIEEATSLLNNTLVDREQMITATLGQAGDRLVSLLETSGSELENNLSNRTKALESTMIARTRDLGDQITVAGSTVASMMADGSAQLRQQTEALTRDFEDAVGIRVADFSSRMEENSTRLETLLDTRLTAIDTTLVDKGNAIVEQLGAKTSALNKALGDHSVTMSDAIKKRLSAFSQSVGGQFTTFSGELRERQSSLEQIVTAAGNSISTRSKVLEDVIKKQHAAISASLGEGLKAVNEKADEIRLGLESENANLTEGLDARSRALLADMDLRIADLTNSLAGNAESLNLLLAQKSTQLTNSIAERSEIFLSGLEERSGDLTTALDNKSVQLNASITAQSERLSAIVTKQTSELATNLGEHTDNMAAVIDSQVNRLTGTIDAGSQTIQGQIDERVTKLTSTLDERNRSFEQALEEKSVTLLSEMDNRSQTYTQAMEARSESFLSALAKRVGAIATAVDSKTSDFLGKVDQSGADLQTVLDDRAEKIVGSIDERTQHLEQALDSRSDSFATSLEGRVNSLTNAISGKTDHLIQSLDERKANVEGMIDDRLSELGKLMTAGEAGITQAVEAKYGLFSKMLADRQNEIVIALDERIEASVGAIDEKSAAIAAILTERAKIINASLGDGLMESQRLLETKSKEFNDLLKGRSEELSSILDSTALPLVEQIKLQGDEVAGHLGNVHEMVGRDIGSLLEGLATVSDSMTSLIGKASEDLSSMQVTINNQAQSLTEVVGQARQDVDRASEIATGTQTQMGDTARNLLANIGSIAERFETQTHMLESATGLIDEAQKNFSNTLEGREYALTELASGLSERTSEIESAMAAFGAMLTKTMDDMTQRSRMVGSTVAREVGTAIEETTQRFSAATQEMRHSAEIIRRELEETRGQMKRGVMELPEETRQSADAMRKVVADQIAALRDLSEIVTKSGKALDTAPALTKPVQKFANAPVKTPVSAPRPQPAAPNYARPSQSQPNAQTTFRDSESPAAPLSDPMRPFPPETRAVIPPIPASAPTASKAQRAPISEPAPSLAAPNQDQQSGWVTSLLQRASQEEARANASAATLKNPPQSELHRIESLNALSMDIARLIDDTAAADLWQRYQRGERNVFTRRLYTLQGQQTFDEIRQKYTTEPEFRQAVDRYVDDFENLLSDVAAKDRDNIMTQTYLTSDTGKVYTMLAHASGRFSKN